MVPEKITFTDFEVENPLRVLQSHNSCRPAFWSDDWTLIPEPKTKRKSDNSVFSFSIDDQPNFFGWLQANTCNQWDVTMDAMGNRIFAFSSVDEAALFKLAF
jgi:hypothetical protein